MNVVIKEIFLLKSSFNGNISFQNLITYISEGGDRRSSFFPRPPSIPHFVPEGDKGPVAGGEYKFKYKYKYKYQKQKRKEQHGSDIELILWIESRTTLSLF